MDCLIFFFYFGAGDCQEIVKSVLLFPSANAPSPLHLIPSNCEDLSETSELEVKAWCLLNHKPGFSSCPTSVIRLPAFQHHMELNIFLCS